MKTKYFQDISGNVHIEVDATDITFKSIGNDGDSKEITKDEAVKAILQKAADFTNKKDEVKGGKK